MDLPLPPLARLQDVSAKALAQIISIRLEPKFDGIRLLGLFNSEIHFLTRSKREITGKLNLLREEFSKLPDSTVLDGELVLSRNGAREELGNIQRIIGSSDERANTIVEEIGKPVFKVFDVLYWSGEPVYKKSLSERVDYLNKLSDRFNLIRPIEAITGMSIDEAFEHVTSSGGEGIVIKDLSKDYESSLWLRRKSVQTIDLVVKGFNQGGGRYQGKEMAGSLVGHLFDGREFVKVANIYGLSDAQRADFYRRFTENPDLEIVVECKYSHRFPSGGFRFCSFLRIRGDKAARECLL